MTEVDRERYKSIQKLVFDISNLRISVQLALQHWDIQLWYIGMTSSKDDADGGPPT